MEQEEKTESNASDDVGIIQGGSFYYSPDNTINGLDNDFILANIKAKYPDLDEQNKESILKQAIVAIFDDKNFINKLLEHFDLNIIGLFQIIYAKFSFIFSACYVTKIKKLMKKHKYDV